MKFTNDDLRRLKEHLNGETYLSVEWTDARKMIPSLITRLEAAEAVASLATQYRFIANEVVPIGEAVEAWRKSKERLDSE